MIDNDSELRIVFFFLKRKNSDIEPTLSVVESTVQ